MKNKFFTISTFIYLISILIVLYLYLEYHNAIIFPFHKELLFIAIIVLTLLYSFMLLKYSNINPKKIIKFNIIFCFILYLIIIISLTLFDNYFKRGVLNIFSWNKDIFKYYMENLFNIIPFRIIVMLIKDYINGNISLFVLLINILGNFIAFMPFAFFLPILFKKQNNFKTFTLTLLVIVLTIELLQFITLSGVLDIDDIILNTSGACLMFLILKKININKKLNIIYK